MRRQRRQYEFLSVVFLKMIAPKSFKLSLSNHSVHSTHQQKIYQRPKTYLNPKFDRNKEFQVVIEVLFCVGNPVHVFYKFYFLRNSEVQFSEDKEYLLKQIESL